MPRKTDFKIALGNKIKLLRIENSMTQEELGKKLNVGKTTIANYESGYSEPESEKIKKLALIFNVSIDYLLNLNKEIKEKKKTLDRILGEKVFIENLKSLSSFNLEKDTIIEIMDILLTDDITQNNALEINNYVFNKFGENTELFNSLIEINDNIIKEKDNFKNLLEGINLSQNSNDNFILQQKYGPFSTELLEDYSKLNEHGKLKANENVKDLTKINEYTKKNEANQANG